MFWKVLFFVYLIYVMLLTSVQASDVAQSDLPVWFYEVFGITFLVFGVVLALVYLFALGWQKRIVSPLYNKYLLWAGMILMAVFMTFFCVKEGSFLHNDMLIYAMRSGMVPRNPDFQALLWLTRFEILGYAILRVFMIFAPFFFGYYFYTKKMHNFEVMRFPGRKIFASFLLLNSVPVVLVTVLAFIQNFLNYNSFDILSILCSLYLLFGVYGYAFNKKFIGQEFWRLSFLPFVVISFLPVSLNSTSFVQLVKMPEFKTEPILFITSMIVSIGALYLVYKYAYTDEIFAKNENSI